MNKDLKERLTNIGKEVFSYFNINGDLVPQSDAETEIRNGVSFKGSQLLVLILAIFIASIGLNTNSIPVIIGAMLISPLMGPIIGMGVAIGIEDYNLLRRSLKNVFMAMLGAIIASALYFVVSPIYEGGSQLLARTSPSIYDVLVGLFGGFAGIVSICCRNKGNVMPGVAIATSLMPPLCTAGYGLATMQGQFFFGALYLFFINMIFILFASWIGMRLFGYERVVYENQQKARQVQSVVFSIVFVTVVLSAYLTVQMVKKNNFITAAINFVNKEMVFPNTQVLNHNQYIKNGKRYIDVTLIGDALPKDSLQVAMMNKLDSIGLNGAILNIRQGFSSSRNEIDQNGSVQQFYSVMQRQIVNQQNTIDSLIAINTLAINKQDAVLDILPEIKVLFPQIDEIALSTMVMANVIDNKTDTINLVVVETPMSLDKENCRKLEKYISVRLNRKDVRLLLNPKEIR